MAEERRRGGWERAEPPHRPLFTETGFDEYLRRISARTGQPPVYIMLDLFDGLRLKYGDQVVRDLQDVLNQLFYARFGFKLEVDMSRLLQKRPEQVIRDFSVKIYEHLSKHMLEEKTIATEQYMLSTAESISTSMLEKALKHILIMYRYI